MQSPLCLMGRASLVIINLYTINNCFQGALPPPSTTVTPPVSWWGSSWLEEKNHPEKAEPLTFLPV